MNGSYPAKQRKIRGRSHSELQLIDFLLRSLMCNQPADYEVVFRGEKNKNQSCFSFKMQEQTISWDRMVHEFGNPGSFSGNTINRTLKK